MTIARGAGVIRWKASDGRSPYIGENGNWWQWNDIIGDFVDTGVSAEGVDGMPGKVPIQKEWKVGDTHRNDTNIVDFIYVRAALSADRKWYRLNDNYVTRTVPAGETEPSAATIAEYYIEIEWLSALAVNVLLAEEANLANFIFKEGKLISVRGTVDGVAADYAGQANFIPNLVLDGANGQVSISGSFTSNNSGSRFIIDSVNRTIKGINNSDELGLSIAFDEYGKSFLELFSYLAGIIDQYVEVSTNVITISRNPYSDGNVNITPAAIGIYKSALPDYASFTVNVENAPVLSMVAVGLPRSSPNALISSILRINSAGEIFESPGLNANVRTIGATSTLTDTDEVVVAVGSSGITLTMPTATTGRALKIKNRASVGITLSSSQQFFAQTSSSVLNMASGNAVELVYDGTYWCVI